MKPTQEQVIAWARESGTRPWVVWLITHRLKYVLFVLWLMSLPLHFLVYLPDAYRDWRDALKHLNDIQVRVKRARREQ